MSNNQPFSHIRFIMKPETAIVQDAIMSLYATNGGIDTYPICGYLLHSLFLKLTGAQEQKLKCICWEMACRDYDYRYQRYGHNDSKRLGECSSYKDKNVVYNDLLSEIKKLDGKFNISNEIRNEILNDWKDAMGKLFENSLLVKNFKRSYDEYKEVIKNINYLCIMQDEKVFNCSKCDLSKKSGLKCDLSLQNLFENYVYRERNRCAHNTRSYQQNLPTITEISSPMFIFQNYFLYISIIILLDKIFIKLFGIYLDKTS